MVSFLRKATSGLAVALMLGCVSSSVYGFTGMHSTVIRGAQQTQLTGKLVCTDCSMTEARKTESRKYANLCQLRLGNTQAVIEVHGTTNSTWLNHLMQPNIRIRGEETALRALTSQDNVRKDVTIVGLLLDGHTLTVQDVTIHQ